MRVSRAINRATGSSRSITMVAIESELFEYRKPREFAYKLSQAYRGNNKIRSDIMCVTAREMLSNVRRSRKSVEQYPTCKCNYSLTFEILNSSNFHLLNCLPSWQLHNPISVIFAGLCEPTM